MAKAQVSFRLLAYNVLCFNEEVMMNFSHKCSQID